MKTPLRLMLAVLLAGALYATAAAQTPERVELTYIANEGFLVTGAHKKVLVDALLREGIPKYYERPSPETRQKMESAQHPFHNVNLVLATHFHRDHFDAGSVAAHLRANPQATFVSVHEATELVHKEFAASAPENARIRTTTPEYGHKVALTISEIPLQVIRLRHGKFQNTGFLFTVAGKKILHLGDSDGEVSNFDVFDLEKEQIDVALVPYWYFLSAEGKRVVQEHIRARNVIAFHVSLDDDGKRDTERIRREFPAVIIATQPGARWTF